MNINKTKIVKSHFRQDTCYGRTTTLILKSTGEVLAVFMGDLTRKEAFACYKFQMQIKNVR